MKPAQLATVVLLVAIALAHALRLIFGWQVTFNGARVPMWVSIIGVLVPLGLGVALWRESRGAIRGSAA